MSDSAAQLCRLCSAETAFLFCQRVLRRHDVRYFRCPHCDLIQSERPWWLGEAYNSAISSFDTGAIARNMRCADLTLVVAWLAGISPQSRCVDVGGGHGVFVRMMRDRGLAFTLSDKYAQNLFARGFEADPGMRFDLVTCFEVFEHFADVAGELEQLFAPRHEILLISTVLHHGHREGWWYYGPDAGQHIAFYSRDTMQLIARRFGYSCIAGPAFTLFIRSDRTIPAGRQALLRRTILRSRADRNSKWVATLKLLLPASPSLTDTDSRALLERTRAVAA
jgi:hypothetical protein